MSQWKNSNADEVKAHILEINTIFWQALADRNVDLRFSYCADNITFIGSGVHEKAANKQEYIAINKQGIKQYPNPFGIKILWERISLIDTMAWVESEIEWIQEIAGKQEKQLLRNTVIVKQFGEKWLIVHVHGSLADFRLSGNNYITNAETIELNRELEQEVYQRTKDLNQTLEDLRSAQSQLIQSEKMASLGELTAGIAHEIQNPLNFVNNFSEVNKELVDELQTELRTGNYEEAIHISKDIRDNEGKINHHGKRADAIVKGMLQHSMQNQGVKEPTDLNALCDEYLRLSYHGLRAKDKNFNADFKTDFDKTIGKINIVPQDIGRVLLNLFNNAFYACAERSRSAVAERLSFILQNRLAQTDSNYEPKVTISTKAVKPPSGGLGVIISISDNGNGIPQNIVDKIFQPFFTTKPTGQGTGLGLSLSYDIIKAHGGEIKVETKVYEGNQDNFAKKDGSTFIIQLPVV